MIKILFICHGNICRSPMAEYVMKKMVRDMGLAGEFHIESAATSTEELGNPIYPPAQRVMREHGIDPSGHAARQLKRNEYDKWDMFVGMDSENLYYMDRILGGDPEKKISLLMDYTDRPGEVSDPWYTRDFESTWIDVNEGCKGMIEYIQKNRSMT
ncbi:MAG: low molecular weight phosphotyrosine protein phosphatase [Lachnospiraceae bacterium]|nr:low molecular weight phosphotyrosine protein phosphatase [Lachnospiraceae bacterium]